MGLKIDEQWTKHIPKGTMMSPPSKLFKPINININDKGTSKGFRIEVNCLLCAKTWRFSRRYSLINKLLILDMTQGPFSTICTIVWVCTGVGHVIIKIFTRFMLHNYHAYLLGLSTNWKKCIAEHNTKEKIMIWNTELSILKKSLICMYHIRQQD